MLALIHYLLVSFPLGIPAADPACHDSVLFHRGESILPSTSLFCVVRSNQESQDGKLPVIQSEEQRSEIVSEYPLLQAEQIPIPSVPPVILRRRNGQVTEFLLPAAFIGTKCSGVQPLVLGFSQSITCSPEFSSFSESECRSHEFLSASSLFASPLISVTNSHLIATLVAGRTRVTTCQQKVHSTRSLTGCSLPGSAE
ncbi:unnamed protein product [Heligmosomoides polygyrus]|uniref:Secreted protein n=1 Tax=Heligmosomoides polygyrus TaxID=6339 RepID=A0A183GHL0_HELPZ|nr:unnamed protein product [Heligmosomoides polygyrus]